MSRSAFISYRRGDSAAFAGRLRDTLERRIRPALFMHVSDIELGEGFVAKIIDLPDQSGEVLTVIEPNGQGMQGGKRWSVPDDYVTMELCLAIEQGVSIIPIPVDGAGISAASDHPQALAKIATLNGEELRHRSFDRDVDHLSGWV